MFLPEIDRIGDLRGFYYATGQFHILFTSYLRATFQGSPTCSDTELGASSPPLPMSPHKRA